MIPCTLDAKDFTGIVPCVKPAEFGLVPAAPAEFGLAARRKSDYRSLTYTCLTLSLSHLRLLVIVLMVEYTCLTLSLSHLGLLPL